MAVDWTNLYAPGLPLPMCARCRTHVAAMESSRSFQTMELVVRVWCHGAVEETRISEFQLVDVLDPAVEAGWAFRAKALPSSPGNVLAHDETNVSERAGNLLGVVDSD